MQPQNPTASVGWVSFDDDVVGSSFGAAAAPPAASSVAPTNASAGWAVHFDSPGAPRVAPQADDRRHLVSSTVAMAAAENVTAAATTAAKGLKTSPATSRDCDNITSVSATASSIAPPAVFPSFAALYGSAPAATAFSSGSSLRDLASAIAAPAGAGVGATPAVSGSSFQRLPRPPTSASRGGAVPPSGAAANPFAFHEAAPPGGIVGVGASSNPFAPSANPFGSMAASHSLHPFADLSLRPSLPRPPPMAGPRGAASSNICSAVPQSVISGTNSMGAAPGLGQVAGPVGTGADMDVAIPGVVGLAETAPSQGGPAAMAPNTGPTATAGVALSLRRPPTAGVGPSTQGAAAAQPPSQGTARGPIATGSVTVASTAAPSMFPSFAAIHHHQQQQQQPAAPLTTGAMQNLLDGFSSDDSVNAPLTAAKKSSILLQARENVSVLTAATASSSPPPPYSVATNRPNPAPSLLEESPMGSAPILPPPPPYIEALDMPDAQPPPPLPPSQLLPPPSYDEALTWPAAVGPSLDRVAMPLPRNEASSPGTVAAFDDIFDTHLAAQPVVTTPTRPSPPYAPPSFLSQPSTAKTASAPPPDQICVEVRLPPLKPKESAWPKRVVAGMGHLFAAPGNDGMAALQWWLQPGSGHPGSGPEDISGPHFALPVGSGAGLMAHRFCEDADSAPASMLSPTAELQATCCMLLDDVSCSLWTGHKDGRVVRWRLEPGRVAVYEHHWRAHVRGKITSMTLNPWGDLWTASSGGTVRAWQYQAALPASRPPIKLFECRRCKLALSPAARANAQRPHSKARLLCLGPSGRVVWSAGRTGMALWGAYDGEFLGSLTPGLQQDTRMAGAGGLGTGGAMGAYAGDTGALYRDGGAQQQQQQEINPQTGLDAAMINRPFTPRLLMDTGEEGEAGDPDLDLGQQVIKGLAGAAKLAFKLGKKIRQNFAETTGVGSANEAGGISDVNGTGLGSRGKVVALFPGLDHSVYVVYKRGLMEKYTEWGRLLWSRDYGRRVELYSAVLMGSRLWLGCGDGVIRTAVAASGELCHSWKAHDFPVVGLAHDSGSTGRGSALVYSLSENGSVRGWPAVPPSETQRLAWRNGLLPSLRPHKLTILVTTWNVNETRPSPQSLRKWLEMAASADIVSISLQEMEMGTSSVAWDAAVNLLSKSMLERGNQNAQWWSTELASALAATGTSWERVALRQMSGLVIVVFCRAELQPHVGEVATANVACGVMGVGGNKGAVAVSMSVYRRRIMFVCSHFAAHQERVDERNENYSKIVRMLHFHNTSKAAQQQLLLRQQQQQVGEAGGDAGVEYDLEGSVAPSIAAGTGAPETEDDGHGPGLSDAAMLVWAGDFNYRINGTYTEVRELSCNLALGRLFELDQCRIEMEKGNVFRGLREPLPLGHPVFVPTYKYEKGEMHAYIPPSEPGDRGRLDLPFDRSEKQRIPAWTDRVFFRGSRPGSLDVAEEEVVVGVARAADYNCVLDVNDSDHKPVFALLQVQLPGYVQEQKRRHSLASVLAVHQTALSTPSSSGLTQQPSQPVLVSASRLELRPHSTSTLDLCNCNSAAFVVQIMVERRRDVNVGLHALAPLPPWLEVSPTAFYLAPRLAEGNNGRESSQGFARISLRVLVGDFLRQSEPLQLRFVLRPLWGCETLAAALGPVVAVTVR